MIIFAIYKPHHLYASNDAYNYISAQGWSDTQDIAPVTNDERRHRVGLLMGYVRKEGPNWIPGLSDALHNPTGWVQRKLGLDLGFNFLRQSDLASDIAADEEAFDFASMLHPMSQLMEPPAPEEARAMWLSPQYHHKGFLPTHDALMFGINARHRLWNDSVQFDAHPFFGQNWHSTDGYWGTEMALMLGSSAAELQSKPWGKIAVRFTNGDRGIMDSGHGIDMHAEFNVNDRLSFSAGLRENDDTTLGNYVLMRWKILAD